MLRMDHFARDMKVFRTAGLRCEVPEHHRGYAWSLHPALNLAGRVWWSGSKCSYGTDEEVARRRP